MSKEGTRKGSNNEKNVSISKLNSSLAQIQHWCDRCKDQEEKKLELFGIYSSLQLVAYSYTHLPLGD